MGQLNSSKGNKVTLQTWFAFVPHMAEGSVGAVLTGFLFKSSEISYRESLFIIGIAVSVVSVISLLLSVSKKTTEELLTPPPSHEPVSQEAYVYSDKV
jgi:hypothetical protein